MKLVLYIAFSLTSICSLAQSVPPEKIQTTDEVPVVADFDLKYQQALHRIRRVYPLAIQAKAYLVDFEKEYQEIEKRRKQKKFGKQSYKILKDQFVYDIRDLYISEGIMLMKLVHRETGQTVSEIVTKYRGQLQANMYEGMGKIWDQDLGIIYDPYGEDWIVELVIQDIINKKIPFDWDIKPLNKAEFKQTQKDYREMKKNYRKSEKKLKKVKRQTKRAGSNSL
jgi:Domain of unknown function (DUF4294)